MMPQMQNFFLNWGVPTQMQVISTEVVDFEAIETVVANQIINMMLLNEDPRETDRRPEGERTWKFWDGYSTTKLIIDTVLADPEGLQFRVNKVFDWSQAGFYHYKLAEQPHNLGH